MNAMTAVVELLTDLRRLGVSPGDTVMVHASLKAIGPVDGGAAGVIEALDGAVGSDGTLMMVLGSHDHWAWVNDRPEEDREALLRDAVAFDPLIAPADPEVGRLAEVMRTHPGTVVSDNPEGRFAARGRLAGWLVSDQPWNDYFGPGSPLAKLIEVDGRVLRLGADRDTVTLLHHAEYLADIPEKRRVRRQRLVATASGPIIRVVESLDDENGIVDHPGEDYFTTILASYLDTGRAHVGGVAGARSELIDAGDLVAHAVRWMEANLVR
jgi:aminoglycoside N3'-acetyltransferase